VALPEAVETWPDLPVAIKNGIGVRVGDIAYVGLGSAGTDLYALDLKNPSTGWVRKAAFIGASTNSAAATTVDDRIFVFSGNGKSTPDAKSSIIFDSVYTYDPANDLWSRLDTRTPVGLSGAKALPLSDGRIAIVGGYNKDLFDRYLADLSVLDKDENPVELARLVDGYMGMPPEDYKWNDSVLSYDPKANSWSSLGENPFPPNCDSAVAQTGRDTFLLVNGEIKPGLRTPALKRVSIEGDTPRWQRQQTSRRQTRTTCRKALQGLLPVAVVRASWLPAA
jgi:N-acetylneuraminate epimerase